MFPNTFFDLFIFCIGWWVLNFSIPHSSYFLLSRFVDRKQGKGCSRDKHTIESASPRLMLVICMRNWNRRWFLRDYFRRCSSPLCRGVATINYAKRADISGNPGWSFEIPRGLGIRVDLFQEMRDERRLRRTWNRLKIREKWTRYGEIFNGWWLVLGKFERFRQWWTVEIWRGFYCYN